MGRRGACVQVTHDGVIHEGIDCGDATVIHLDDKAASIVRSTVGEFGRGKRPTVMEYEDQDEPEVVLRRATSKLGPNRDFRSGVHFVHWCLDSFFSKTVDELIAEFNREVGGEGWARARGVYLSKLREALLGTKLDCSAFINQQGMSLRQRITRDGDKLVPVGPLTGSGAVIPVG